MKHIKDLVRPNIWSLKPYSTARDEYKGGDISTWLDANENPYNNGVNRYPDPHQRVLKLAVSKLKKIEPERIFIGNGSDEAIDMAFRVFCRPGIDNAVSIAPTYGMYSVAAEINDVEMRHVQLNDDFSMPTDSLLAATDENTKLMWICSPNNPTGNAFPQEDIERLLREFNGMVVIDEAYIDFADNRSFLSRIDEFPNLIVLQTFSKAWGMAGLRLGLAFADKQVIELFSRVKYPYNINTPTQITVTDLISRNISEQVTEICSQREILVKALAECEVIERVYPSDANFLLVRTVINPTVLYDVLIAAGIIVRNRSSITGCENCLRITIGTPDENRQMLEIIKNFRL